MSRYTNMTLHFEAGRPRPSPLTTEILTTSDMSANFREIQES